MMFIVYGTTFPILILEQIACFSNLDFFMKASISSFIFITSKYERLAARIAPNVLRACIIVEIYKSLLYV